MLESSVANDGNPLVWHRLTDPSGPERFLAAQNRGEPSTEERALTELRAGRKRSHWIWFVLPQLRGLGRSAMAQRYGLDGLGEARAYLANPLLRQRLEHEGVAV